MSSLEEYSYYGTPLATGEDSLIARGKKAAELKDRALDPQTGKLLRFHGAFTGGFSSGYYNTVSTKEGWTPSQFFSSREQRFANAVQHPEDFMDDEDFSDHGIAPKKFQPSDNFSLNNKRTNLFRNDGVTKSLLEKTSLLTFSNTSSIGFDLMRTMGWKDGQGVGPVVLKNKKVLKEEDSIETMDTKEGHTNAGNAPVPNREASGSESEGEIIEVVNIAENTKQSDPTSYSVAPRDLKASILHFKDDKKGLDYTGMRAPNTLDQYSNNSPVENPFHTGSDDQITSLFGGTLDSPYEPDLAVNEREWYRQEVHSDEEENSFGWSGGGDGVTLASFEQVGNLCCVVPPCKVKIPPNFTPTAVVSNIRGSQVQPYSEHSAVERGQILGEKSRTKLQLDSSALKFNPLVQSLSSRFVPAQHPDTTSFADHKTTRVLETEKSGLDTLTRTEETKPPDKNKEVLEWHPHRILCKRFNVPDPFPSSGLVGIPYRPEKLTFSSLMLSMGDGAAGEENSEQGGDNVPWYPTSSDHLPTSDQRPPIDLFTSVFGGDSSSDSDEMNGSIETPADQTSKKISGDNKSGSSESQTSLQVLAQMASKEVEKKRNLEEKNKKRKSKFVEADEMEGDRLPKFSLVKAFGPDLPPELLSPGKQTQGDSDDIRDKYADNRYKRKDREKERDRKYPSRYHDNKRHSDYHHYSSSSGYRRK